MDEKLSATSKRVLKAIRNAFIDPLPRNHTLTLEAIRPVPHGVDFIYRAKGVEYGASLLLPEWLNARLKRSFDLPQVGQSLASIGIALAAKMFSLTDFQAVRVNVAPLDDTSIEFFEQFFLGGLGEFRYLNGLDPARRVEVQADRTGPIEPLRFETDDRVLLLNGGGKDTAVAAELLQASGQLFTWLTVGPNLEIRRDLIAVSGVPDSIDVRFRIDEKLVANRVYGWGHTPFVSLILSIGLLVALLTRTRYVVAGNELSANYGNVRHRGREINHQYTKSSEYEQGFHEFVRRRVTDSIRVFSILRPFHDLQLAELFVAQEKYLGHFVSCNNPRNGQWCKHCAKCAFTALAIAPFVDQTRMDLIFKEDVFRRPEIRQHILALVAGAIKPWECVGTRDECALALGLLLRRFPRMEFNEYPRRSDLEAAVRTANVDDLRAQILERTSRRHLIPDELLGRLNRGLLALSPHELRIEKSECTPAG